MELVDCRRLTGPSLVAEEPCAVLAIAAGLRAAQDAAPTKVERRA